MMDVYRKVRLDGNIGLWWLGLDVLLVILIYEDCPLKEHDGAKPPYDHEQSKFSLTKSSFIFYRTVLMIEDEWIEHVRKSSISA